MGIGGSDGGPPIKLGTQCGRTQTATVQNDVTRHAHAGDLIFEGSQELHGLRNEGSDSATYLVIRFDLHDIASSDTSRCITSR